MKIFILVILLVFISGCSDKEEKKVVQKKVEIKKQPVKELVKKVQINQDKNVSFSQTVEADGIVVDGARDEELLDAFGLAVSQIMTEEGVSVPDCTAIAKTEYLTKEECDAISDKYFGFYDIYTDDGVAKKVEDVFEKGIAGDSVEIREEQIEYFDSSGNPLLDNLVEFEEFVDKADNKELLEDLLRTIPDSKMNMKEKIKLKMKIFKDSEYVALDRVVNNDEKEIDEANQKIDIAVKEANQEAQSELVGMQNCGALKTSYEKLKIRVADLEARSIANPRDEFLYNSYISEYNSMNEIEAEMAGCQ
jgi:polyhydroxyalkanoate synthesis regulator phasin